MRRSKEIWYLLLFSLLIAAVTGLIMTVGRKEEKNSYTVSVIVNNSSDSRDPDVGPVSKSQIKGTAWLRLTPNFGLLK